MGLARRCPPGAMRRLVFLALLAGAATQAGPVPIECLPLPPHHSPAVTNPYQAIAIAHWAWKAVYGKAGWRVVYSPQSVSQFEPFKASLSNGIWHVWGTSYLPEMGRGPEAYICASNAKAVAMGRDD
jgi:hypothetical protein